MSMTQLTMWLQHALRRIHGSLSRERRLAGVTCLLVAVFICCYLPFWTVYICLVRADMDRVKLNIMPLTAIMSGLLPLVSGAQYASGGAHTVADPGQRRHQPRHLHRVQH